jgi:DNA-binding transcriptional LysR family regulator
VRYRPYIVPACAGREYGLNNIQQLKYAVEVEKTGSISKAAENLYMNQPNLSKSIRDLEEDLGITIFARTGKGMVPTERGREFLSYAKDILAQIAQMEALYKPAPDKKVRFDVCVPRASYISYAFTEFVKSLDPHADIGINYRETNSMRAIRNVAEGVNNLAVVRYQTLYERYFLSALTERSLQFQPIWEFSYLALMSKLHPLARREPIDFPDLQKYTEIIHGDLSVPALPVAEARVLAQANEKKKTIAVYERGSQFELLSRIPTTYMWVSPMPPDVLDCFQLVEKRCAMSKNKYKDILITRTGYQLSQEDLLFIQKMREAVELVSRCQPNL